jgi:hypothetical protein
MRGARLARRVAQPTKVAGHHTASLAHPADIGGASLNNPILLTALDGLEDAYDEVRRLVFLPLGDCPWPLTLEQRAALDRLAHAEANLEAIRQPYRRVGRSSGSSPELAGVIRQRQHQ